MLWKLILLFTVVPLAELFLLLWMAEVTNSALFVFGLVLVTGVVGATLARWQGVSTWRRAHADMDAGRLPADSLLDGVLILIAGGLLLTPGILTDLVGFSLLIPPFRLVMKRYLVKRFKHRFQVSTMGFRGGQAFSDAERPDMGRDVIIESRLIDPPEDAAAEAESPSSRRH